MQSSIVIFRPNFLAKLQKIFFCNLQPNCIKTWLIHGHGLCVILLISSRNFNSATNALTLFLRWFQVLHMSGSRRQCRGVHPPQLPNQSLPVSGFCCRLHAHTPEHRKNIHTTNAVKNRILNLEALRITVCYSVFFDSTNGGRQSLKMLKSYTWWL